MNTENWLPIPGWETYYEVSDHGRVRSLDRLIRMRNGAERMTRGRIVTPTMHYSGRPVVRLNRDHKSTGRRLHRLVIETFVGPPPPGTECCHNDGDSTNNRVENLRWDTRLANNRDQLRHGTHHQSNKTHCIRGHLFSEENVRVVITATGIGRRCRRCHRDDTRARRQQDRANKKAACAA